MLGVVAAMLWVHIVQCKRGKIARVLPCLIIAALGTTKITRNICRRLTSYIKPHVRRCILYPQYAVVKQWSQIRTTCIPCRDWWVHSSNFEWPWIDLKTRYNVIIAFMVGLRVSAVERQSLASVLSPSCARPVADGWPLMWVSRPL